MKKNLPIRLGVVIAAAGVLALSACSSSTSATGGSTTATAAPSAPSAQGPMGGGGVSGEIAAVSGTTLQVQDSDSQTAVSYSDSTTITSTVAASLNDVTVGICITSMSFSGMPGSSTSSADAAATSVVIADPVDGACETTGFGGRGMGGTPPTDLPEGGMPTDAPDGASLPTDAPEGDAPMGGAPGGGGFASGLVTAVSGSTISVETTADDGTVTTSDVTVDDSTSFTRTVSADASALAVGACVVAQGESDDSGAVAATSLAVSEAGEQGCTTGFGGGQGGPGARPGADSGTSGS